MCISMFRVNFLQTKAKATPNQDQYIDFTHYKDVYIVISTEEEEEKSGGAGACRIYLQIYRIELEY